MIQRPLDNELKHLKEKLIAMAGYAESAIALSIESVTEKEGAVTDEMKHIVERVQHEQRELDCLTLEILATQAPLAEDLRFVMSVVKINIGLERMVKQASNIVRNTQRYCETDPVVFFEKTELANLSRQVRWMVRSAMDAFVKKDLLLAENVLRYDDTIDALKAKIIANARALMKKNSDNIDFGIATILIARNFERVADYATQIAEGIRFCISGKRNF